MKCGKCNYEWEPRKENPVSCPECKTRLSRNGIALTITYGPEGKAFVCSDCLIGFKVMHYNKPEPQGIPLHCPVCGKSAIPFEVPAHLRP